MPDPIVGLNGAVDPLLAARLDRSAERVRRHVASPHRAEPLGLRLARAEAPTPTVYVRYPPCLSIVLSGRKRSVDDDSAEQEWGRDHFLITPVDLPLMARVVELGDQGDFLSVNRHLDPAVVAEVASQMPRPRHEAAPGRLGAMTPALADAVDRLLGLLDAPEEAAVLAPLLSREIVLRLLQTDQAARLLHAAHHADADVVGAAVRRLDAALAHPWTAEGLAASVGASEATLRRRFRELTGLSPMSYLKRLRLGDARRRMLVAGETASRASAGVGYLSPSHFSRDYRAAYGRSPAADTAELRVRMRAS